MYFIPLVILLEGQPALAGAGTDTLDLTGFVNNLVPVTLGNIGTPHLTGAWRRIWH